MLTGGYVSPDHTHIVTSPQKARPHRPEQLERSPDSPAAGESTAAHNPYRQYREAGDHSVPDDPTPPQSHPRYLTVLATDMCHHHSAAIILTIATALLALGSAVTFSARHELPCAALAVIAAICGHAALSMYSAGTRLRGLRAFAADHASGRAYFASNLAHVRQDADQHLGLMLRAAADEVPRLHRNGHNGTR